jgi:hypothetical protein
MFVWNIYLNLFYILTLPCLLTEEVLHVRLKNIKGNMLPHKVWTFLYFDGKNKRIPEIVDLSMIRPCEFCQSVDRQWNCNIFEIHPRICYWPSCNSDATSAIFKYHLSSKAPELWPCVYISQLVPFILLLLLSSSPSLFNFVYLTVPYLVLLVCRWEE